MQKICRGCSISFQTTEESVIEKISPVLLGEKIKIPPPTICPNCRQQRRFVWRNERALYTRTCDKCKKNIIAAYPQNANFPVYCNTCWWDDSNDTAQYGQAYNFEKPFFQQFHELLQKVPRINLSNSNNENCEYVNYTNYSKDCYLIFGNHKSEKCAYCWRVHDCVGCFDCTQLNNCQYCYSSIDCDNCYELFYGQNCQNCSNSQYLYNCRGLKNCFICCNLFNKEYYIMNQQYSKEEYQKKLQEMGNNREKLANLFQEFILKFPRKALNNINCENCRGDYLINCFNVFSAKECLDCSNVYLAEKATDCHDCDIVGWPAELCYEGISTCVNAVRNYFCSLCWTCSDIQYCDSCFNSQNLFGCTEMKQQRYCILNKQYTKEEYEKMLPRIIEHMKKSGEYGEFFPMTIAPFAYDESIAQEYFPLTKEQALKKGIAWADHQTKDKPFRIINQEEAFYKKYNLSLPTFHPDQRNKERMELRNPRKFWQRQCDNCKKMIESSYAPNRPEIIFCDECYLKEVY